MKRHPVCKFSNLIRSEDWQADVQTTALLHVLTPYFCKQSEQTSSQTEQSVAH